MLMKVFNKGQVVIPSKIRRLLNLEIGDFLDVTVNSHKKCIELQAVEHSSSGILAGSLWKYKRKRKFPSNREINEVFQKGMTGER